MTPGLLGGATTNRNGMISSVEKAAFAQETGDRSIYSYCQAFGAAIRLPAPLPALPSWEGSLSAQRALRIEEGVLWEDEEPRKPW